MFSYDEAMVYIENLESRGSVYTLEPLKRLLNELGNPQDKLKIIHIAGTNGKGSVAAYLENILYAAGYSVGSFTSPAVFEYNEKFKIDAQNIRREEFQSVFNIIYPYILQLEKQNVYLTAFMAETAIAYYWFCLKKTDYAIIECGLGGEKDATNTEKTNLCSVITQIALDHTDILGDTLEQIAMNKCGIIRPDTAVITTESNSTVLPVIEAYAENLKTKLVVSSVSCSDYIGSFQQINYKGENYKTRLLGNYQNINLPLAIETIRYLKSSGCSVSDTQLKKGVENTTLQGRFEIINRKPLFIIDGAHNSNGSAKISEYLKNYCRNYDVIMLIGIFADKDYDNIIKFTTPYAKYVYLFDWDNPRSLCGKKLAETVRKYNNCVEYFDTVRQAVTTALSNSNENTLILAFGSLSHLAQIRKSAEAYYGR